jgi:hypothetical protein
MGTHAVCGAVAVLLASLLAAQTPAAKPDRRTEFLRQSLAALDDPERHQDTIDRLTNFGSSLAEPIRLLLRERRRDNLSPRVQQGLLQVLGNLGRAGSTAWRDVFELLREDDVATAHVALWTLGMLSPFLNDDQNGAIHADLRRLPREVGGHTLAGVLESMTRINEDSIGSWPNWLMHGDVECLALCRWLRQRHSAGLPIEDRDAIVAMIERRLAASTERSVWSWADYGHARFVAPDLAEAWLALTGSPLDARCARAVLDHWHVDARRRGLSFLRDQGAALPVRERVDVVARLWDHDPTVAELAAGVLADWQLQGCVGLAPLRLLQQTHAQPAVRGACERAAAAILAAGAALAAPDRALLTTIDAALRGEPLTAAEVAATAPAGERARELAGEVLHLASWSPAPRLEAALEALATAGPVTRDAQWAVFGWLLRDDAAVVGTAWSWLVRQRIASWLPAEIATGEPFEQFVLRYCRYLAAPAARPVAIEAAAWLLTENCDLADLRLGLDSEDHRRVSRCLAALLSRRAGSLRDSSDALRRLVAAAGPRGVHFQDESFGRRDRFTPVDVDLAAPVRVLAGMALAELGEELPTDEALVELVQRHCDCRPTELAERIAAWRQSGELLRRLDALEADCRQRLGVPPHLRWPQLAGR